MINHKLKVAISFVFFALSTLSIAQIKEIVNKATLSVTTIPKGATVYLNKKEVGNVAQLWI